MGLTRRRFFGLAAAALVAPVALASRAKPAQATPSVMPVHETPPATRFADLVDRSFEREIVEQGQVITVNKHKYVAVKIEPMRVCDGIGCDKLQDFSITHLGYVYTHVWADGEHVERILIDKADTNHERLVWDFYNRIHGRNVA